MGRWRRENWRRRASRDGTAPREQETLLPCRACRGAGKYYWVDQKTWGQYCRACPWCMGTTLMDRTMLRLYGRYCRLAFVHGCRLRGR